MYARVTGWESFEPWLSRVEEMAAETLWGIAEAVPPEWYGGDTADDREADGADAGAAVAGARVDRGVPGFEREPFPMWAKGATIVVPRQFAEVECGLE